MARKTTQQAQPVDIPAERAIVYAIRDKVAGMLIGGLYVHKHDAAAIRFFSEAAKQPESMIGKYPADFELVQCAIVDNDGNFYGLDPSGNLTKLSARVTLTGEAWAASQAHGE